MRKMTQLLAGGLMVGTVAAPVHAASSDLYGGDRTVTTQYSVTKPGVTIGSVATPGV